MPRYSRRGGGAFLIDPSLDAGVDHCASHCRMCCGVVEAVTCDDVGVFRSLPAWEYEFRRFRRDERLTVRFPPQPTLRIIGTYSVLDCGFIRLR